MKEISVTIVNTFFCNASVIASRAVNRGMSKNSEPPLEFTFPSSVKTLINSSL